MKIKIKELKEIIKEVMTDDADRQSEYLNDMELDELRDAMTSAFQSIKHLNVSKSSLLSFIDDLYDDRLNEE